MPVSVKLFFNQFDYPLLFSLYPCLFLSKSIQLCLSFCDLLPMHIQVIQPCIWILIPNIKKSNDYIPSKVVESFNVVSRQLSLVILIFLIVQVVRCELKDITILRLFFGLHHPIVAFLVEGFLNIIIDLLILLVQTISDQVSNPCVLLCLELIIESVHVIAAFQGIRMHNAKLLVEYYSSASLFGLVLIAVFGFHVLAGKDALLKFKIYAVFTEHFRKDLALDLFNELVDSISEGEISLESGMGMQIEVHEKSLIDGKVFAQLLDGNARRLLLYVRICVVSIEILVENVHPAMSSRHSIWIEHRNQHKHKVLPQQMSSHIFLIQQKLDDSVHAVTRRRFYGMHSSRNEDYRLVASEFNDLFVLERHAFDSLIPFFSLMRRDDNTIDYSSLVGLGQFILLKKQVLIVFILLLHLQNILSAVFIRIRINERKLNAFDILGKEIIELQCNSFVGDAETKDGMWQSKPFCCWLMVIVDSVNGSIQLRFLDHCIQKMYAMDGKCDPSIDEASSFEIKPTFGVSLIISALCIASGPYGVMLI